MTMNEMLAAAVSAMEEKRKTDEIIRAILKHLEGLSIGQARLILKKCEKGLDTVLITKGSSDKAIADPLEQEKEIPPSARQA